MKRILVILLLVSTIASLTFSHPGRKDKNGCHREKKTGKRHCH